MCCATPSSDELAAAAELREEPGEQPARWLETAPIALCPSAEDAQERAQLFRGHGLAP